VGNPADQPPIGEVQTLTDSRDLRLPLDAYLPTRQQESTIGTARDILIRECMGRFGFDYPVQQHPMNTDISRRYGISAANNVDKYGYHPAPEEVPAKPTGGNGKAPSEVEQMVLTGQGKSSHAGQEIPERGCAGEADGTLGQPVTANGIQQQADNYVLSLSTEANLAARADTRVLDAWGKWSQCMDDAGYDYRDPWAANDNPEFSGDTPSAEEISTAKADLRCREMHNVAGINLTVETAYQNRLIERNSETLRQVKTQLDERVRKATELAGGR